MTPVLHTHEINSVRFIVEEDGPREWFWTNGVSESKRTFESQADALTDAMRWVRERGAEERERAEPDNYRAEVTAFFDRRDQI